MRAAKASAADHRRLSVQRLRSTAPHRAQTNSHPAGAGPSRCESPHRLHAWIVWTLIPTDSWECCPLNVKHRRPETRGYTRYSKGLRLPRLGTLGGHVCAHSAWLPCFSGRIRKPTRIRRVNTRKKDGAGRQPRYTGAGSIQRAAKGGGAGMNSLQRASSVALLAALAGTVAGQPCQPWWRVRFAPLDAVYG